MHVGVSGKRLRETAALIVTRTGLCSWKQILGQIREAIIPRVVFKSPVCDFEEAELSVLSRALAGTASLLVSLHFPSMASGFCSHEEFAGVQAALFLLLSLSSWARVLRSLEMFQGRALNAQAQADCGYVRKCCCFHVSRC